MTAQVSPFDKGDRVKLTFTFTDPANADAPVDPADVAIKTKSPAGIATTSLFSLSQVTKVSAGIYYAKVTLNESGRWTARAEATTGSYIGAVEITFDVNASAF